MFLKRLSFLFALSFLAGSSSGFGAQEPSARVPEEFVKISESIRSESSRKKRFDLFVTMQTLTKKRVMEVPTDIQESDIPKTEVLFELDLFLSSLKPEMMNPVACQRTQASVGAWANPRGDGEEGMTPTGRFVLGVVKSLCRE